MRKILIKIETTTTMFNISLIVLSLKYINNNYGSVCNVSKWIFNELTKIQYNDHKLIRSLIKKDFEIIKAIIKFIKFKFILNNYHIITSIVEQNRIEIIKLLIENEVKIFNEALISASFNNCYDIVKLFLQNNMNVHMYQDYPLRCASEKGHFDTVKLLIDNGANIHAEDNYALRWASENGHLDTVKLLIDNGANIHAKDDEALKRASTNGHFDVVKLLLNSDTNIHTLIYTIQIASSKGYINIVNLLKSDNRIIDLMEN